MQKTAFFRFTVLVLSLIIIGLPSVNAQSRQRWSAGPRLGLNMSKFIGNVPANKYLPGASAGIGFTYSDISHFGFAFDILYSQRGAQYTNGNARQRINYIEVPITLRYFLNNGGNFRPNVFIGPSVAFKAGANFDPTQGSPSDRFDNAVNFKPADIGLTGGLQLNFRVRNRQHFLVDLRFTQGISDVSIVPGNVRNQTITVGLGYNFGIGRNYRPGERKLPVQPRRL
jgi:hypothetical protein